MGTGPSRAGEHAESAPQRAEAHHSSGAHASCADRSGTSDRSISTASYHKCRSNCFMYCNRMRKSDGGLIQILARWDLRRRVFQDLCCRRCALSLAVEGPHHVKQFHKLCCHRCAFPLAAQQLQSMNPCLGSSRSGGRMSSNSMAWILTSRIPRLTVAVCRGAWVPACLHLLSTLHVCQASSHCENEHV